MTMDIIVIMRMLLIIFHLTALHGEDFVLVLDDGSYDLYAFHGGKFTKLGLSLTCRLCVGSVLFCAI
jgi:hypothetical protein